MLIVRKVYLDHAATTPTHPKVVEAMLPYFTERFGNPSNLHDAGREAKNAVEEARAKTAALINAKPEDIYFTSSGTESNNFALKGIAQSEGNAYHRFPDRTFFRSSYGQVSRKGRIHGHLCPDGPAGPR